MFVTPHEHDKTVIFGFRSNKVRFGAEVLPEWALIWLMSPNGRAEIERVSSSTAGLLTLSTGKVRRLPLPLPPVAAQRKLVDEVERRLSLVRSVEAQVNANFIRVRALRGATLKKAFESYNLE